MGVDGCSPPDNQNELCNGSKNLSLSLSLPLTLSLSLGAALPPQSARPLLHCGPGPHLNGPLVFCVNKSAPFAFVPVTKV